VGVQEHCYNYCYGYSYWVLNILDGSLPIFIYVSNMLDLWLALLKGASSSNYILLVKNDYFNDFEEV
jgi:hypothetical protein